MPSGISSPQLRLCRRFPSYRCCSLSCGSEEERTGTVEDINLSAFEVSYRCDGELRTELVLGHNDNPTPSDEDALHYTVWRYMPNGERTTAFRCRYNDWVATAAPRELPPTRDEVERRDAIDRADMAEMRALDAKAQLEHMQARVEELEKALRAQRVPGPDEVPF